MELRNGNLASPDVARLELEQFSNANGIKLDRWLRYTASVGIVTGKDVLDIGAGAGLESVFCALAYRPARMTIVDDFGYNGGDPTTKAQLTHRLSSLNLPIVEIVQGDAFALPFPRAAFDVALLSQTMHHLVETSVDLATAPKHSAEVDRAIKVLTGIRNVLRPGGRIIIREVTRYNLVRALSRSGVARRAWRRVRFELKQQPRAWSRMLELAGFERIAFQPQLPRGLQRVEGSAIGGMLHPWTAVYYVISAVAPPHADD